MFASYQYIGMLVLSSTHCLEKLQVRNQARKAAHSVFKPDDSVHETFEDLLSKYKQIQLELECIRKEETMALEPKVSLTRDQTITHTPRVPETKQIQEAGPALEEQSQVEPPEKKVFQAFNIRPLRQKLPFPAGLDDHSANKNKGADAELQGEPH